MKKTRRKRSFLTRILNEVTDRLFSEDKILKQSITKFKQKAGRIYSSGFLFKFGSSGRIRTYNLLVNSQPLYR